MEWWRRTLGNLQLQKLKRAHFFEARDRLTGANGERLAIATVNKRMALIAAVLTRALDRDWIQHHPARIRRLTEKNQRERILDEEERHSLLDACKRSDEPALYPFVVSAMISGARAGELKNLRMKDTNLMIGTALLSKTKSGRKRSIPLRGEALAAILSYHACANTSGRVYLFSNRNKNSAFDYRRSWDKARREASLLDVHFHDLRHLAASELAMSGASAREIQFLLGHASAQMTARYSHLLNNHHVPLGDRLNERFFPSR
ncbi:MAG: site-specific integrase [Pseudomonadota bacterium]